MACLKRVANDGFILNIVSLYTHPHISIPPIALTNSQHSLQRGHTLDTVVGNTANRTTCTLTVSPICTSIQYCMTYRGLGFVAPSWRFPSIVLYISAHAVVAERELNHTVRVEYHFEHYHVGKHLSLPNRTWMLWKEVWSCGESLTIVACSKGKHAPSDENNPLVFTMSYGHNVVIAVDTHCSPNCVHDTTTVREHCCSTLTLPGLPGTKLRTNPKQLYMWQGMGQ